nr:Clp protease N-terminal domain-containing protein [Candidatus Coxiella mudrowiae]
MTNLPQEHEFITVEHLLLGLFG